MIRPRLSCPLALDTTGGILRTTPTNWMAATDASAQASCVVGHAEITKEPKSALDDARRSDRAILVAGREEFVSSPREWSPTPPTDPVLTIEEQRGRALQPALCHRMAAHPNGAARAASSWHSNIRISKPVPPIGADLPFAPRRSNRGCGRSACPSTAPRYVVDYPARRS